MDGWFLEGGVNTNATPWTTGDRQTMNTNSKTAQGF
jgi:hypothetical protein